MKEERKEERNKARAKERKKGRNKEGKQERTRSCGIEVSAHSVLHVKNFTSGKAAQNHRFSLCPPARDGLTSRRPAPAGSARRAACERIELGLGMAFASMANPVWSGGQCLSRSLAAWLSRLSTAANSACQHMTASTACTEDAQQI